MSPPSLLCGEDRFYCHPGARGSDYTNYKNGKNRGNGIQPRNISKNFVDFRPAVPAGREETCRPEARPPPAPRLPADPLSNIDRFLQSTTPSVPAQYLSKATTRCLSDSGAGFQPYFVLDDLWEAYTEWSVYGAGVPLVLRGRDRIVQYYVPYLSGIQLYAESTRHAADLRRPVEESDGDLSRDSSSDVSSDSEFDGWSHSSDASAFRSDRPMGDKNVALSDGFSSDDSDVGYAQEQLLFEYFEREIPYSRVPFADKISELACQYPELRTLRCCDLLPTSWVSVAWYPIYRIPAGPTMRDFDACFLTFHSLSMPGGFRGDTGQPITYPVGNNGDLKIPFPATGMASYKLHGSVWTANGGSNRFRFLQQEADKLLRQLQVYHPDYQFFVSRSFCR